MRRSPQDPRANLFLTVIATCAGAAGGALVGAIFVAPFASHLLENIPNPRLYCAVGGAFFGGVSSCFKALRQLRRQADTSRIADELGMEFVPHLSDNAQTEDEDSIEEYLREMLAAEGLFSANALLRKQVGSAKLVVAEVTDSRRHTRDSSSHMSTKTVAYFEAADLHWPNFTMQPEGLMLGFVGSVVGLHDIDFDTHPVFSAKYHLSGFPEEAVRALFTPDLLQALSEHPNLEVRARANRLVMVYPGGRCEPEQLESFLHEAMEVFGLLMEAAIANEQAIAVATSSNDPRSQVEQMPGLLGSVLRRQLVTRQELDAFLEQPTPRQIPPNIRRQRLGSGNVVLILMGGAFALVGLGFAVYSAMFAEGPWNEERIVPLVFAASFTPIGLPMLVLSLRYRAINRRLLRHGQVTEGMVTKVHKTSVSVNNQQQYRVTFRFQGHCEATVNAYGPHGREAKKLAENQTPIRLLCDPRQANRVLWAESLMPRLNSPN